MSLRQQPVESEGWWGNEADGGTPLASSLREAAKVEAATGVSNSRTARTRPKKRQETRQDKVTR